MAHINLISSIGLIFDIGGVAMLFLYGLPSQLKEHGGSILLEEKGEESMKREKENGKIMFKARIGLTLILIGFILQLVGVNCSF